MSKNNNKSEVTEQATTGTKSKNAVKCPEDYSPSSQIARAYSAGCFPNFTHQKLFHAVVNALNGQSEGNVDFSKVLAEANLHRSSALQIIRHMTNFGLIEVSFHSSQSIGEKRKSWVFVKILRNPEGTNSSKSANSFPSGL